MASTRRPAPCAPPGLQEQAGEHRAGDDVVNALDRIAAARTCTPDQAVGDAVRFDIGTGDGPAGSGPA